MINIHKHSLKKYDTREKILKIAERLFANFGYLGTALAEIAKEVNITKASLYYHFDSKQQLFTEVLTRSFVQLENILKEIINSQQNAKQKMDQITLIYLKLGSKHSGLIQSALNRLSKKQDAALIKKIKTLRQNLMDLIEPLIKQILKENKKGQLDSHLITHLYFNMMDSFLIRNSLQQKKVNYQKIAHQINLWLFK